MNILKTISIYIIIIIMTVVVGTYYALNSTLGAIIILKTLHRTYPNQYIKKINFNLNKLTGNFVKGLQLQEISYHDDNYDLKINLNIKINLIDYILKKKLFININKLSGIFNNQPLTGSINIEFSNECINLSNNNFIKIGDNLFELTNPVDSKLQKIIFTLNIKDISMFCKETFGNLKVKGEFSQHLDYIIINKISSNKLLIKNKNIAGLFNPKLNQLNLQFFFNPKPIVVIDLKFKDLNNIMDFIPELSRLKGTLEGTTTINFNNHSPKLTTNLNFKDISVTLPSYGVKIKPLNISFIANNTSFINVAANGAMRNGYGTFKINGKIKPFDFKNPLELEIKSNIIEFINIPEYHLIGKVNLKLLLTDINKLNINGDLNILKGLINLEKQTSKIVKSKDVIFINQKQDYDYKNNNVTKNAIIADTNYIKIFPDIDLRIEEQTYLKGEGFNANITGKLKIYTLNDDYEHWLGNGRITIKQGTYVLSNQKFIIDKGRMIYLPGTLINNPILDIKVSANKEHLARKSNEKYLYIEGTLENPVIKDVGLIDENQAILQILNLGNNPVTTGLKEKFNLSELGIQDNDYDTSDKFKELNEEESFLNNKHFVIGKKVSKKIDFKYFKTLNTSNNTVKLKYNFNPNFSFEIESSTVDGHGSDFSFYKEIQ